MLRACLSFELCVTDHGDSKSRLSLLGSDGEVFNGKVRRFVGEDEVMVSELCVSDQGDSESSLLLTDEELISVEVRSSDGGIEGVVSFILICWDG
jgi:hypothetical protein